MKGQRITRERRGRGFGYRDENGEAVRDRELRRWIAALAIPPAWTEVEINPNRRAKIHATGRDDAGRKQYIYNPAWRARREREKYDRIIAFARRLGAMRRVTGRDLGSRAAGRRQVLACMVRLLDTAWFRPGDDAYVRRNDSYGLTTLRSRHLGIEGDTIVFRFIGKSGQPQEKRVADRRLARIIAALDRIPGREIFKYFDGDGNKCRVTGKDLNAYIREVTGGDFSAKDFRTWAGTVLAALALDELGEPATVGAAKARMREAIRAVAYRLGNTPAIAKASYIDPRVTAAYLDGQRLRDFTPAGEACPRGEITRRVERAVLKLLESRRA